MQRDHPRQIEEAFRHARPVLHGQDCLDLVEHIERRLLASEFTPDDRIRLDASVQCCTRGTLPVPESRPKRDLFHRATVAP